MNQTAAHEDGFLSLLRQHDGIVRKVARVYAYSPADREDLGQEIVAQLWRSYARYDEHLPFATWMYRVALNVAISFARGESRRAGRIARTDPGALENVPEAEPQMGERAETVFAFIEELDELQRALVLLYLDGYPYDAIAEILGLSTTNVATKLQRVKARLREQTRRTL